MAILIGYNGDIIKNIENNEKYVPPYLASQFVYVQRNSEVADA